MKFIDAKKLGSIDKLNTDICIVGGGVAGITIASELADGSQSVSLIESGKFVPDEALQSLYTIKNTGYPVRKNFMHRARYFGGTSNLWPGRCMILSNQDLRPRSWVTNSGWPLEYSELYRYYNRAAIFLGLPSFQKFDPIIWARRMSDKEKSFFANQSLALNVALWAKRPLRFGRAFYWRLKRSRNVTVYLNLNLTEITPSGR